MHAGVSRATASLVLRNSPLVADATRNQVLASMDELGYVYNRAAASLRSLQSHTIGLVVTDITNPFFAELAVSIESQLDDANYAVLLSNTRDQVEKQNRLLQTFHGHQVDGILLCPADGTPPETIDLLRRWRLPVVLIARYVAGTNADYAGPDNRLGASMAVDHLVEQGHRRIAFLGGMSRSSARQDRQAGYQETLQRHDLPVDDALSISSAVTRAGGFEALSTALDLPHPPTAAICYNDVVALGAMLGLQSRRIRPGREFAITGFDDIADAALVQPALTTIAITPQAIGQAAISLLMDRIAEPDRAPQKAILSPKLIVRDSTISFGAGG
jgi:LacI family transcriptional regulator